MPSRVHADGSSSGRPSAQPSWCPVAVPGLWPVKTKHFDGQLSPLRRSVVQAGRCLLGNHAAGAINEGLGAASWTSERRPWFVARQN
ncbi:hypothetical protein JNB11_00005 [Kocuria palustris]|nr:hypothetical protein [Kocuria palustris]